jgi:Leucine-rich repeat (LRR) protein
MSLSSPFHRIRELMIITQSIDVRHASNSRWTVVKAFTGKVLLAMVIALGGFSFAIGQSTKATDHPILNTAQLDKQPWFYNLDSALANPEKVYKLALSDSKVKELPAEFGKLRNLQMSNCGLKAVPHEIKECKNLQMISLFGNRLKVLPAEMHELKKLEILYLGQNKLFEIPDWFGTMGQLKRLDISRNNITPADVMAVRRMLPHCEITY